MFPLFDAHCDTAGAVFAEKCSLRENSCHTDLLRGASYAPRGQVYALWKYADGLSPEALQAQFWGLCGSFLSQAEQNSDILALCETYQDICAAFAAGKQAAMLSVEGCELFGCDEAGLEKLREMGVRIVHLCWNSDNALCGAAADSGGGLTARGRDFVRLCKHLGVMIDLSHASDATVRDVLRMDCTPVLAGHSNCRALCDVPRNLPDELLRAVAESGGVVGLNLYPPFLGGYGLEHAARHAEHMLKVCGENHVCLGCDLDGVTELPEGISGIQDMPLLRRALSDGGLNEEQLEKVFFGNLMRFWERTL
ncbi:MAG: dipeptidase [Candidatus Heteroscillospira sp.]